MKMGAFENLLALFASLGVALPAMAVGIAFAAARVYFGWYVYRAHPDVWRRLTTKQGMDAVQLKVSFDVTPEMAAFRADSGEDLGDAELARRRAVANRAEARCPGAFILGGLWIVACLSGIALYRVVC